METLKLPQTFGEPSSLRASVSVESLLLRDREEGLTFEPTTLRSDSLFDVRGQSSSPLTTNLHHVGKVLFFPVTGLTVDSFHTDAPSSPLLRNHSPSRSPRRHYSPNKAPPTPPPLHHGQKVSVNGRDVALFHYRDQFYAVDDKCPHMGGPIHLGDIEDGLSSLTGQPSPCVVCPWHKWCFELTTGRQTRPPGREKHIRSYPVKVDHKTGRISIGFASIEPSIFTDYDF